MSPKHFLIQLSLKVRHHVVIGLYYLKIVIKPYQEISPHNRLVEVTCTAQEFAVFVFRNNKVAFNLLESIYYLLNSRKLVFNLFFSKELRKSLQAIRYAMCISSFVE